ncbi:MAG: hypothetical protein WC900_10105 [Oscillospiraceae bacterium]|jgi:hypothetical protein
MDKKITRANYVNLINSLLIIIMGTVSAVLIVIIIAAAIKMGAIASKLFYLIILFFLLLLVPTGIKIFKLSLSSIKIGGLIAKFGYTDVLFSHLSEKIAREKSPAKRAYHQLVLASSLERGKRNEEALEVMSKVDYSSLRGFLCAEYYNCYAWIYLSMQDTENAGRVLESGKFVIQPYRYSKLIGSAVNHTYAVYDYCLGKLNSAETLLLEAKGMSKFDTNITSCDLFLALIYLKTNRKELARDIIVKRIGHEGNPRNREDLQKLMKKIERAFAEA